MRDKRSTYERQAADENPNATSFAQQNQEMTCYCCGKKGHLSPDCDKKNTIPRENWHVNRAMQNMQERGGEDETETTAEDDPHEDDESALTS